MNSKERLSLTTAALALSVACGFNGEKGYESPATVECSDGVCSPLYRDHIGFIDKFLDVDGDGKADHKIRTPMKNPEAIEYGKDLDSVTITFKKDVENVLCFGPKHNQLSEEDCKRLIEDLKKQF